MNLNNDNNLSQNSTMLPNKNEFQINDSTGCMITNQQMSKDDGCAINEDYLQLDTFDLDRFDQQTQQVGLIEENVLHIQILKN